ncbi:MAG: GNAT family N-acetyltransferase [Bacteroidota bacterium]
MNQYKSIETERLILQPASEVDAPFFLELFNTPTFIKYIGDRNIRTTEAARTYIKAKMAPQLERLGYGNFVIIRKEDNFKIGTCGLFDREGLDGIDIGFALLPDYEKQGYAYEAARKVMQAAFTAFGLTSLSGITTKENLSSQRLLEKLGFTLKGSIRIPNDPEELLLYEISKS